MIVLGLDTSTMTGGACLVDDGGLVAEYTLNIRSTHSERLLPAVETLLRDADVHLADVKGLAVATGPGSFTGLRIGLAAAKAISYARELPVVGVTVLEALARQNDATDVLVCALIDSRRGEVYGQVFRAGEPINAPYNGPLDSMLQWCQQQQQPVLFCGNASILQEESIRLHVDKACFPALEQRVLRSASVAGLGRDKLLAGQKSDPMTLVPFYMRVTEAERKWETKL